MALPKPSEEPWPSGRDGYRTPSVSRTHQQRVDTRIAEAWGNVRRLAGSCHRLL